MVKHYRKHGATLLGVRWSLINHSEWPLGGSEKNGKQGQKRGRNDDDGDKDSKDDESWQAEHDSMRPKHQQLDGDNEGGKVYGKGYWRTGGGGSWLERRGPPVTSWQRVGEYVLGRES